MHTYKYAFCVPVLGSTYNICTIIFHFKLQCLSLTCSCLWITCLIHIVASANSEGIHFTGMCMECEWMCKELLYKLSFVRKDQLQPSHVDN